MKPATAADREPPDCAGRRFGIVAARFYPDLTASLIDGARRGLRACNVADDDVHLYDVAGCFELPLACAQAIEARRLDAVVALGVVIRGETAHFDVIARECARGIMDVMLVTKVPIGFGVLTTETAAQAQARADARGGDKGYGAAVAAASLLSIG